MKYITVLATLLTVLPLTAASTEKNYMKNALNLLALQSKSRFYKLTLPGTVVTAAQYDRLEDIVSEWNQGRLTTKKAQQHINNDYAYVVDSDDDSSGNKGK